MKKIQISFTWFIPIFVIGLFLTTPLTSQAAVRTPKINTAPCYSSNVDISYNIGDSEVCYANAGYTGASLNNAVRLATGIYCGWVLLYSSSLPGGKRFETFNSASSGNVNVYSYPYPPSNTITQIGIQGQNCRGSHS